jgi:hypothetical protein
MGSNFCSGALRVHRLPTAVNQVIIDAVFYIACRIRRTEKALIIGFILGEKQRRSPFAVKKPLAQF